MDQISAKIVTFNEFWPRNFSQFWPLARPISQPNLACGTVGTQLSSPDIAPHRRQATVARVAHDLFIGYSIAVGRGDKPGAHAVRTDRFKKSCFQPCHPGAFEENLAYSIRAEPARLDISSAIDLAKDWAGFYAASLNHACNTDTGQVSCELP